MQKFWFCQKIQIEFKFNPLGLHLKTLFLLNKHTWFIYEAYNYFRYCYFLIASHIHLHYKINVESKTFFILHWNWLCQHLHIIIKSSKRLVYRIAFFLNISLIDSLNMNLANILELSMSCVLMYSAAICRYDNSLTYR